MERIFSVPLKSGQITDVYSSANIDDIWESLEDIVNNALFVADSNTMHYLPKNVTSLVLPAGECEKKWNSIDQILSKALSAGLARDSVFVAVGGGVILDMTAFAASLYMRGARLVLVPTTLLSMVDATLGGKTGIDYGGGKNLVGTFYPAESVIISSAFLSTLPEREYMCGLGEVVKHAFLSHDRRLYDYLSENRKEILARSESMMNKMIHLSLEVKIDYITRDPEEKKGIRSALNLGHTFGHALEALKGFSISHGEGVAWGMAKAFEAGKLTGITDPDFALQSRRLIDDYGFDTETVIKNEDFPAFMSAISKDKKKKGGAVRFVLMGNQGQPVLTALDEDIVRRCVSC